MVHLGDRLGLYRALADADAPLTTTELAERARARRAVGAGVGLQPGRGARSSQIDGDERLSLVARGRRRARRPGAPGLRDGQLPPPAADDGAPLERLPESFRTGLGLDYDAHGPDCAEGIARGFEPWMRANLLPDGPAGARWRRGASCAPAPTVLDVGLRCRRRGPLLAEAFPASRVTGYDISQHALDLAAERQAEAGVTNVDVRSTRVTIPMPADGVGRPRRRRSTACTT